MSRNITFIQRNLANVAGSDYAMPTSHEGWDD
jgi:hypothetical protein